MRLKASLIIAGSLLLSPETPHAQEIQWEQSLGGNYGDYANALTPAKDGGYVIAGWSTSAGGDASNSKGGADFWVTKLSENGTIKWERSLGGSDDDEALAITQAQNGGYIVVGSSNSDDGDVDNNHGKSDYWVIKLSKGGRLQWETTIGGSRNDVARAVSQTNGGDFIVAGSSKSEDEDVSDAYGGSDYWVVKLNQSGEMQWEKTYGGNDEDVPNGITKTANNSFVIAGGSKSSDRDVSSSRGGFDYWILSITADGEKNWENTIGGSKKDMANAVIQTAGRKYLIAGYTRSSDWEISNNHGSSDYWVTKLDENGYLEWETTLGGSKADKANALISAQNTGYIVAGFSESSNGDVQANQGKRDFWVAKINRGGELAWDTNLGGSFNDEAQAIGRAPSKGYLLAGASESSDGDISSHRGGFDFWVSKVTKESQKREVQSKPKLPPIPKLDTVRLSKRVLKAGQRLIVKAKLTNRGEGPANNLKVKLTTNKDQQLNYPDQKVLKSLEAEGGKGVVKMPVKAKRSLPEGRVRIKLSVTEPNFNVNVQGQRISVKTKAFDKPNLVLAKYAATESQSANPDNEIGINEQMALKVVPQNVGKGVATDVKVKVTNDQKGIQFLGCGKGDNLKRAFPEYRRIGVGEYKAVTCHYFINSQFKADELRFKISAKERIGEFGFNETKTVPINDEVKDEGSIQKVEAPDKESTTQKNTEVRELPTYGVDVEKDIPKTPANQPNTYALIIGNENYTKYQSTLSKESNVDFAKRDAEVFAKYVRKTLGVPSDNIRVKTNLTAATMKRQIEWLKTRAKYSSDSVQLIFYYSGHGFPHPETKEKYLMPVNVTGAQVTQGIQLGDLYDQLTQHKTKRATLFLDACFSGAGREQGLLAAKSVKIEPKENAIMDGKLVAFSSSQGDQQSFFYKEKKHGLFTYYLLKKLKQTKGEVTYGELYNYVKNKVPFQSTEIYGAEQVPGVKFSRAVKREWKNWKIK